MLLLAITLEYPNKKISPITMFMLIGLQQQLFLFGYGPVSVTYSPAGTTAGGVLVESISKGWTQLRIRGNVRESKYTVTVYDKYSGNRIKSYKETKKTTENIWYDTRRA